MDPSVIQTKFVEFAAVKVILGTDDVWVSITLKSIDTIEFFRWILWWGGT
jgi:hypothetical protein